MITRAIVEEILTPYQIRVRIPLIDRVSTAKTATKSKDLSVATICSLPRTDINLQPGDIVFVAFEDDGQEDVVILGTLYRETLTTTVMNQVLGNLTVNDRAIFPKDTTIGDVSAEALHSLKGAEYLNIKEELDAIKIELETLKNKIG